MTGSCPICQTETVTEYLRAGSFRLVQCVSCGLIRADGCAENPAAYQGAEYFVEKNRYVERWDEFCRLFDTLLDKIARYKKGGRFLDVGCGVGSLVSRAQERGYSSHGVEISPWASDFARVEKGLAVVTGFLAEAAHDSASFDVVVINHVLEHVPEPCALLREAGRILKPDGLLVLGVPNIGSLMARLAGADWASLRPDEHRWHFAPDTIEALVQKAGFRLLRLEAKENHRVVGWGVRAIARRLVNGIALVANQGEAMLVFAVKSAEGPL